MTAEEIAQRLVALMPARAKAAIIGASSEWRTSGVIASATGSSGAQVAQYAKDAPFHEKQWAGNCYIWRLNELGLAVRSILQQQEGRPVKPSTSGPEPMPANPSQTVTEGLLPTERCPTCDDTGDVHRIDGEWLGICDCPAGKVLQDQIDRARAAQGEG